jgi:hypothetical protein
MSYSDFEMNQKIQVNLGKHPKQMFAKIVLHI